MADKKKVKDFLKVDKLDSLPTIKNIEKDKLDFIIAEKGFLRELLIKDYYITVLLFLLKEVKGIHFKGGTALQKTILDYSRLSEDIDFTLDRDLENVKMDITKKIIDSKLFREIAKDKDVDGFTRLIVHYDSELGKDTVFIDLNERGNLLTKPELKKIKHFYPNIPPFELSCLSQKEMIAEKMAATIGRNKPRDHFDLYKILKKGYKLDLSLVKKKCEQSGDEYSIIKMFNRAKKLKNRWDEDMIALLSEQITFQEVMTTLAKHFNLKEEKDKLKNKM